MSTDDKLGCVFLSVSVPHPDRHPRHCSTGDVVCIREAVAALASEVLPRGRLVWGGHPDIAPLLRRRAERLGLADRVETWVSEFFRHILPPDTQALPDIRWVEAKTEGREASLSALRETMLARPNLVAGVFIGGMEGVEDEFDLVRRLVPNIPCFPIGSTGAAAQILLAQHATEHPTEVGERLAEDLGYAVLFRDLLRPLLNKLPE